MVLRTHRDEPTARDVKDQVVFRGKSDQGILGLAVLWTRGIEEIYSDRSCIGRRFRAWQEDLTTECDRPLMTNKLKLINKLLDAANRVARGIIRRGCLFSPRLRGAFQQLGPLEIYAAMVVAFS